MIRSGAGGRGRGVPQFGPEDRAVFEARATELYEIVVASGGIKADDPRVAGDADSKAALKEQQAAAAAIEAGPVPKLELGVPQGLPSFAPRNGRPSRASA